MNGKIYVSCRNVRVGLIYGGTLWLVTFLASIFLSIKDGCHYPQPYLFAASSLFWTQVIFNYMIMTVIYLQKRIVDFGRSQATFSEDHLISKLKPYNSPFIYIVAAIVAWVLGFISGRICFSSITQPLILYMCLHCTVAIYVVVTLLGIALTFVRYRAVKRLQLLLPVVKDWKDEGSYRKVKLDLECGNFFFHINRFKNIFK